MIFSAQGVVPCDRVLWAQPWYVPHSGPGVPISYDVFTSWMHANRIKLRCDRDVAAMPQMAKLHETEKRAICWHRGPREPWIDLLQAYERANPRVTRPSHAPFFINRFLFGTQEKLELDELATLSSWLQSDVTQLRFVPFSTCSTWSFCRGIACHGRDQQRQRVPVFVRSLVGSLGWSLAYMHQS